MNTSMLKSLLCFLLFSIHIYPNTKLRQVDKLLQMADYYVDRDDLLSLRYAKQSLQLATERGNEHNKAWAYLYIAKGLLWQKKLQESLLYANRALATEEVINDPILFSSFKLVRVSNYSRLHMLNLIQDDCKAILKSIEYQSSADFQLIRAKTLYSLALSQETSSKVHNANISTALKIINLIPRRDYEKTRRIFRFKAELFYGKGEILLENNKMDSARIFLINAYSQAIRDSISPKSTFLESLGSYYQKSRNSNKALEFYLKSLDEIDRYDKKAFIKNGPGLLEKIYKIYGSIGDRENERLYIDKYNIALQQFAQHLNTEVLSTTNKVLDEKVLENSKQKNDQGYFLFLLLVLGLFVLSVIIFFFKSVYRKKDLIIEDKEEQLLKKHSETISLSLKVDDALSDVIEAAKTNSPEFWALFQKFYPSFVKILLTINSSLKTSELILCAYTYLGFTTKEIATYTFKAVQTVKNNKHNVRKRLSVPSKQDLTVWLRNLYDT